MSVDDVRNVLSLSRSSLYYSSDLSPEIIDNDEDAEEIVNMMYLLNFAVNINWIVKILSIITMYKINRGSFTNYVVGIRTVL